MFTELQQAIEDLAPSVDERELAEVIALRDRLDARAAELVAEVDTAELWRNDGSVSMTAWLRRHGRMTGGDAQRLVKAGQRVRRCQRMRTAWRDGQLSSGQVGVITANVTDPLLQLWSDHEEVVVDRLIPLDVRDTATAMQTWAMRAKVALALEGNLPPDPPTCPGCSTGGVGSTPTSTLKGSPLRRGPSSWPSPRTPRARSARPPSVAATRWLT